MHRLIGCFASSVTIAIVALTDASAQVGGRFDPVADVLIAEIAGPVASAEFIALADSLKPIYLDSFWSSRYPLFHKHYVRPLLGDRRYSVSDAFFERGSLLPFRQYRSEFAVPDSGDIARSTTLLETTVELTPEDPIALCALGYLYLESDRLKEAERFFVRALREDRRMAEARNGRGLAVLKQGKRTRLAIKLLEETVATDPQYAVAWFDLAMAHLGEESVDMHFHFDKVIRKFPDH